MKNDVAAFVEVDDAFLQILGWSAEDLIGHRSLEFIHPDDEELAIRSWMAMLAARDVVVQGLRRMGTQRGLQGAKKKTLGKLCA